MEEGLLISYFFAHSVMLLSVDVYGNLRADGKLLSQIEMKTVMVEYYPAVAVVHLPRELSIHMYSSSSCSAFFTKFLKITSTNYGFLFKYN